MSYARRRIITKRGTPRTGLNRTRSSDQETDLSTLQENVVGDDDYDDNTENK